MVVLQNFIDLLKVVPGLYNETCLTSCDGNQVISIKVEDFADTQEEEDPLLTKFPVIKSEHEVSCMSVCIVRHFSEMYRITYCVSHFHLSPHETTPLL
jgi:hypothetical protein